MTQNRITRLVAGLLATSALVAPLSAVAATDRVEKSTTMERGSSNGTNGYWISIKERVFRWVAVDDYVNRITDLFPEGSGLTPNELSELDAMFKTLGLTDAEIIAAVNAWKSWKAGQPGNWYNGYPGYSSYGNMVNQKAANLANAIQAALPGKTIGSGSGSPAHKLVTKLAQERNWYFNSDPLVFDLNGNGKIDVTGLSSAKMRAEKNMRFVTAGSVLFDIMGNGQPERVEWVQGGDGLLIDNRKNQAKQLVAQGKPLTIYNLFGDADGNPGGFFKLARFFDLEARIASAGSNVKAKNLGIIKGKELSELLMWIDNGDGKAEAKELHTLASLGITEIHLPHRYLMNKDGELIEQATFVRKGKTHIVQEVWFSRDAQAPSAP
jgi:hypothetical protein